MTRLWDPYAPANIRNPYKMYDRLRDEAPVYQSQTGEWILTRYDDVFDVLGNDDFVVGNRLEWMKRQMDYLKDDRVDFEAIVEAMHSFLVLLNPPEHGRIRERVSKAWSDHNVEDIIDQNIQNLLIGINGRFDLVNDFAVPLPVMTICRIMGIDLSEYKKLKGLSEQMIRSFNLYNSLKDLVTISKAARQYVEYFREYIKYRKQHIGDDLVSKILVLNNESDDPLSEAELISTCIFLFVAGEETTVNLIGNGMLALLQNLHSRDQLVEKPELTGEAVNEFLRYDAPVQLVGRIAGKEHRIDGHLIPKGSTLTLVVGAANRDPEKYQNPNELSFNRSFKQNLAFGRGKHFCLGAWLAKVQGRLAVEALLDRCPKMHMEEQELVWNTHLAVRGLRSLWVKP